MSGVGIYEIMQKMKENGIGTDVPIVSDEFDELLLAEIKKFLDQEWAVGAMDRGHGHYSYGVIVKETEELIVKCGDFKELAENIVESHNEQRKANGRR